MIADMACGAELPLVSNPQILCLDEDSATVRCWEGEVAGAFRYSFVSTSGNSCWDVSRSLLARLGSMQSSGVQWVLGWRYRETGQDRIRSRFVSAALEREGWALHLVDGLGLAARVFTAADIPVAPPENCRKDLQGFFAIMGRESPLQALSAPPLEATMRHFCWTQQLQPSRNFVEGIVGQGIIVAYTSAASDVRKGLVVIGPESLAPDLMSLKDEGVVGQVRRNDAASLVWESPVP